MPTRDELYNALRNADKAGDAEGARKLAAYIQSLPAEAASAAPAEAGPLKFQTAPPNSPDSAAGRVAAGAALGVSDIGNTVLNLVTAPIGKVVPAVAQWNRTRNADFDALTEANKDSTAFKAGRLGGNVAATAPVGGALAQGVRAAIPTAGAVSMAAGPTLRTLANAIESGGMRTGLPAATTTGQRLADLAYRTVGGATTGAASTALIDPDNAGMGAAVGGGLPGLAKLGGGIGNKLKEIAQGSAESLMQSALKPTLKQLANGDAGVAVRTLLDYGINPTKAGVEKLRGLIDDLNTQVADKIANSTAKVQKSNVLQRLADVKTAFGHTVSPTDDIAAIDRVGDDFLAHPLYPGPDLPVQAAQKLKQGTYRALEKKYGQMGGAEVEAQKGLARGLKEEISNAVPEVAGLNAEEAKLIKTLKVSERRALMDLNKNPGGLAWLGKNPAAMVAFMADRSAAFKAIAARMVNGPGASVAGGAAPALEAGFTNPLIRGAADLSIASDRQ